MDIAKIFFYIIAMNNADLGMTLQSRICYLYNVKPNEKAKRQFESSFNASFVPKLDQIIETIFNTIKHYPVRCTTFEKSTNKDETLIPYNFVLENGQTLSVRTSKSSKMVAPRVVGQAGFNVLNSFFSSFNKGKLFSQEQIRKTVYKNINEMLPTFVSYLLNSDYTIWVYTEKSDFNYYIVDNNVAVDIEYKRNNFSFTRDLESWLESNTLKYNGISIAEVQTHKNRTFKFRFNFPNLIKLFIQEKYNTETIGITAEKTICDLFSLKKPASFETRYSKNIEKKLAPVIEEAFKTLPKPTKHTGSLSGIRNGSSKCSYDFILEGNKTLSLKTNTGKMVCPPEVGQPNDETFHHYFKSILNQDYVNELSFKNLVLTKPEKMMPIYIEHLFDSDYLLRIYEKNKKWNYKVYPKNYGKNMVWEKSNFSFSKPSIAEWNESNTVHYKNFRLGEFQYHKHRNCYKFRFDFENLINIIKKYSK